MFHSFVHSFNNRHLLRTFCYKASFCMLEVDAEFQARFTRVTKV